MLATLLVLGVRLPTRRTLLSRAAALGAGLSTPRAATAEIGPESNWPLWLALPVAPRHYAFAFPDGSRRACVDRRRARRLGRGRAVVKRFEV